jgi:hypothetical protein
MRRKVAKFLLKQPTEVLECELGNLRSQISSKDTKTIKIFPMVSLVWKRSGIYKAMSVNVFMYSSITNKMQRYKIVFITINDLKVSGGSSAHHQELKTEHTTSGSWNNSLVIAVRSRKRLTNPR